MAYKATFSLLSSSMLYMVYHDNSHFNAPSHRDWTLNWVLLSPQSVWMHCCLGGVLLPLGRGGKAFFHRLRDLYVLYVLTFFGLKATFNHKRTYNFSKFELKFRHLIEIFQIGFVQHLVKSSRSLHTCWPLPIVLLLYLLDPEAELSMLMMQWCVSLFWLKNNRCI